LLGLIVGLISGNRWSMLAAPAAFMAAFEMGRMGISGPSVDVIQLDSIYGVIALLTGRVFHGLLAVLPILVGSRFGVALSKILGNETGAELNAAGWTFSGLGILLLTGLIVMLLRPPTTHPILGPDGNPLPGSVAELKEISLGGQEQTVMIRGRNINNPVLLYLAGGPGGTDLGAMRADVSLEEDFVVATWDQRGTGKSYSALDPLDTLTLERMISDTVELSNYLRERFHQKKIYLVGNSWGTILGVLAAQRNPELYYAFVGTGQMVDIRETDIMFWEDAMDWAESTGNIDLAAELRQIGPPPYQNLIAYEPIIQSEHSWNSYPGMGSVEEMPFNTFVPENSLMDRVNAMRGLLDTYSTLYPQLQDIDFREDVQDLNLPVYVVLGKYEARGRKVLVDEWYEILEAPYKELIVFDHSGHRPNFEEPAEFSEVMARVLDATCQDK
jgi:pimeloyl-ACP methyl ester carboxylesterase